MKFFFHNEQSDKVIQLLKDSRQDFRFDPTGAKPRLIQNLNTQPMEAGARLWSTAPHVHVLRYSVIACSLLLAATGTFAYASNAKPGDTLFPVNKLGQRIFLSLPLSPQTKANFQTRIVISRLSDLDAVEQQTQATAAVATPRVLETIQESDDSVNEAIETISTDKNSLQAAGNMAAAQQLDQTLAQLQNLAAQHEQRVQMLEDETNDTGQKQSIETHRQHIHAARAQAMLELNLANPDSNPNDSN